MHHEDGKAAVVSCCDCVDLFGPYPVTTCMLVMEVLADQCTRVTVELSGSVCPSVPGGLGLVMIPTAQLHPFPECEKSLILNKLKMCD